MDIDEANSDDWSEFYVEVIESLSTNRERNKAVGNLKQFHDFLMMVFDCPPASIGGQNRELSSCRATLVTEKDYQSVLADRKSTRLNSSHVASSYAVFCLKKK